MALSNAAAGITRRNGYGDLDWSAAFDTLSLELAGMAAARGDGPLRWRPGG